MAELTLYQAEWCPFSSAVREVMTELGLDFVARQVEPQPDERAELQAVTGTNSIPVLRSEDGRFHRGVREIFAYLHEREPWRFASEHRRNFAEHGDSRESDVPGQLIEYFLGTDELEAGDGEVDEAEIVHVPEKDRYELRLDGRLIGLLAYRRSDGRMAITHTEVDPSCEGRGLGSRLAAAALDDAAREGLEVAPLCPFIAYFIAKHPEYEKLIAPAHGASVS